MSKMFRSLLVLSAMIIGLTASARDDNDSAHFGARAAFDYTNTTSYNNVVHWGPGFAVGASYYAPFGKIAYFNMSLMFFNDTFKYDGYTGEDATLAHLDGTLSMLGLKLPLQLGLKYYESSSVRMSVYTGPQLCYNLSMRSKYTSVRSAGGPEHFAKTINSNGMDLAWTIGLAADIKKHWHVHAEYSLGFIDFTSVNDIEIGKVGNLKRQELSVGVGYNF